MAIEPDPKTAARIAALQEEMDAIHHANRTKAKRCRLCRIRHNRHTLLTEAGEYTDHRPHRPLYSGTWRDTIALKRPCATCTHARMRWRDGLCVTSVSLPLP